jgi:serine/threonine protein phosphatase 1
VIFGHTPFKRPLIMPNKIGIDTGAVYGNLLTCLKLPQEEFFSRGHGIREKF